MVTRKELDPLDEAEDALMEMKRLGGNEDEREEITGQVHVPSIHIHAPQPSSPEIPREPPPTNMTVAFEVTKRLPPKFLGIIVLVLGLAVIAAYVFLKIRRVL